MPLVELTLEQAEKLKFIRENGVKPLADTVTKTCKYKLLIVGKNRSDFTRNGKFRFFADQHKRLCAQNGKYHFIVFDGGVPIKRMDCSANNLDLTLFSYFKDMNWSFRDISWANIERMLKVGQ